MIVKTVYANNLKNALSYTVECGSRKAEFRSSDAKKIGEWVKSIWATEMFPAPAYIYYNGYDWAAEHILYCKYEQK